jgi:hypothetical protein
MDLRTWITSDLGSLQTRLTGGVLDQIPHDRRAERLDESGVVPTYALWHMSRHHDVAVNRMIRGVDEVVESWTDRVGVSDDLWRGLAEAQDSELVEVLDPQEVDGYVVAVLEKTARWVQSADLSVLEEIPDSTAALASLGAPEERFGWLYSMWDGKPASFFLQWEAIGHGYNHLGELMSIRNRMGLSPF